MSPRFTHSPWTKGLLAALLAGIVGCSSVDCGHIEAIPARRVPPQLLHFQRSDLQELTLTRLRQDPPQVYQLGPGDVLGVYIENVLGQPEVPPAVHFPQNEDRPPAVGFPVVVREDGTIALPLVPALKVAGLSLAQTEQLVRKAYTQDQVILKPGQDRIMVTLMRRRTYRVLVVREETGAAEGVTKRGTGVAVDLPAYENDVLHALNLTGGMPGLDAQNEITILRGGFADATERDQMLSSLHRTHPFARRAELLADDRSVVRIPLRFPPEHAPQFTQEDIILESGDIVLISARDREVYYTGGAMPGGQHPLPRDYDLDILGAIALANGAVGNGGTALSQIGGGNNALFNNRGGRGTAVAPSRAIVLRRTPDGGQIPIRVDLNRALVDPRERILIQPEDVIIVKYTLKEELINVALSLIQVNVLLGDRF